MDSRVNFGPSLQGMLRSCTPCSVKVDKTARSRAEEAKVASVGVGPFSEKLLDAINRIRPPEPFAANCRK